MNRAPRTLERALERAFSIIDPIASRPWLAISICAATSFVGSAAVALLVMWPLPHAHDEHSYLLAADTFVHGRMTNPTHPLWHHFESFHIFHEPSYASKYPPAQGLALALGIAHAGEPLVGVWLSGALLCASVCWLLYAVVAPRWAFVGGLAATLQIGIASAWTQTYWGGALAATGGALVLGAAFRLAKAPLRSHALALAFGLVVLASPRPYEGAITSLAAAGYLIASFRPDLTSLARLLAPGALVLALFGGAMAAYNQAVVGRWYLPPYLHHEALYAVRPTMALASEKRRIVFRHEVMRRFYEGDPAHTAPKSALDAKNFRLLEHFFLGRSLLLPFAVGILAAIKRPDGRTVLGALALGILALVSVRYFQVHYSAPITGAVFALVALGLERMDTWRPRRVRVGSAMAALAILATCASLPGKAERVSNLHTRFGYDASGPRRAVIVGELEAREGRDLVIVEYGPLHNMHHEYVYNAADIDGSEIVWARDMGAEQNRALLAYFNERRIWRFREGFEQELDGLAPESSPLRENEKIAP